jgi:hypothetical protein
LFVLAARIGSDSRVSIPSAAATESFRHLPPKARCRPETFEARSTLFVVEVWGIAMKEEIKRELQRKIAAKFDQALSQKMPPHKVTSEEQRKAEQDAYVETLYRAALKGLDHPMNPRSKNT